MSGPTVVTAVPITPPLAGVMELASIQEDGRVELLTNESTNAVAQYIRAHGLRWIWVEGFSGAGKTEFAARLAHSLGWRHVELDALVTEQPLESTRYAYYMDASMLKNALGSPERRQKVVVEGVCLRDVMSDIGDMNREMSIYIAKVTQPVPGTVVWHDGIDMEQPDEGYPWLILSTIEYHGRSRPWEDADRIFLRVHKESPVESG